MAVAVVVAEAMAAATALLLSRGRWRNLVGILSVLTGRLHGLCVFLFAVCGNSRLQAWEQQLPQSEANNGMVE